MMFVKINGLSFRYKNAKQDSLVNFNLDIEKGKVVCILGESGSGKSTALRLIAGLEIPKGGSIFINEKCVVDSSAFVLPEKRDVGMVFQDYALFPHMTISENIGFGLKKVNGKEKKHRISKMLELVNLEDYAHRYPYELSGGQQQRVAIARAVAPEPSLLLLDEPFSNLDAHLQSKIRKELNHIIRKTGITSIFVTHDMEDARSIADKIITLEKGEIVLLP
jgi:iron(III) transport system ATP-binding protein